MFATIKCEVTKFLSSDKNVECPNFSASLLMNIIILDFHCWPNTNFSKFRLPMIQLYIVF